MSATPLPRAQPVTLYGAHDLSLPEERQPGPRPVATTVRRDPAPARVVQAMRRQLELTREGSIVYLLLEASQQTDLKAATTMYEALAGGPFAHRRLALLHGRIPSDERDDVMRRFRDREIDVLVATTVIEVGIDVANATVMVIEHPER